MMAWRTRLSVAAPLFILADLSLTQARSALPAGVSAVDMNAPIAINADNFLADLNGETLLYTGNVIVTQGMTRLHADRVKVSSSGGKASRVEANGHVVVDTPSGQAVGDSGVYDVAEQMLRSLNRKKSNDLPEHE
jgi:lipopolysaccharide export system protein LptA